MFRIRRIHDDLLPRDREAIEQMQAILREQFPLILEEDVAKLAEQLRNPLKYRFRSVVFAAEEEKQRTTVLGFALVQYAPDLRFCYLDYLSSAPGRTGGGVGGALYERARAEASSLGAVGLFFECLPDDPALCPDPQTQAQNAARLRFYERYGARPIVGTAYETPLTPDDDCPPYLVLDPLGREAPLRREEAREIVRAILARKYGKRCPKGYVRTVVNSFRDDPVRLRPPRYVKEAPPPVAPSMAPDERIFLVVNDKHDIHHVHERGYVESPVRIPSILKELEASGLFERAEPRHFPEKHVKAVHDSGFVDYLRRVSAEIPKGKSIYPYVFPIRNPERPPKDLPLRAGYYCIDTFTPINANAYLAATRAVDCALTCAQAMLRGRRLAYALVRPPGHHAERRAFGGFCYFNSAAVAADFLSAYGPVAVLDIDYHHGNGTQNIFWRRGDVLTVSIHGHPRFAYPYFSGFEEEKGEAEGEGCNLNIPLPEQVDGERYREALRRALERVKRHRPSALVVSLGLDPAKGDPTGSWSLTGADFEENGRLIGETGLPVLAVQEGGYRIRSLGVNARRFFQGLWRGVHDRVEKPRGREREKAPGGLALPPRAGALLNGCPAPGDGYLRATDAADAAPAGSGTSWPSAPRSPGPDGSKD